MTRREQILERFGQPNRQALLQELFLPGQILGVQARKQMEGHSAPLFNPVFLSVIGVPQHGSHTLDLVGVVSSPGSLKVLPSAQLTLGLLHQRGSVFSAPLRGRLALQRAFWVGVKYPFASCVTLQGLKLNFATSPSLSVAPLCSVSRDPVKRRGIL